MSDLPNSRSLLWKPVAAVRILAREQHPPELSRLDARMNRQVLERLDSRQAVNVHR